MKHWFRAVIVLMMLILVMNSVIAPPPDLATRGRQLAQCFKVCKNQFNADLAPCNALQHIPSNLTRMRQRRECFDNGRFKFFSCKAECRSP